MKTVLAPPPLHFHPLLRTGLHMYPFCFQIFLKTPGTQSQLLKIFCYLVTLQFQCHKIRMAYPEKKTQKIIMECYNPTLINVASSVIYLTQSHTLFQLSVMLLTLRLHK